jgi:DNA invertase Pin-like site-specific DNA recombinase
VAQCVIYTRVSTRPQAWGHGLVRQLETCVDRAKKDNAYVVGVFTDVCSGTGPLPQRELAIRTAGEHCCPIYVEAMDRWSRKGPSDAGSYGRIVLCADLADEFAGTVQSLVGEFLRATEGTRNGQ